MARFERGVIYWSPTTGAHPVTGGILEVWSSRGYQTGPNGYPLSDEYDYNGVRRQDFQQGVIDWSPNWTVTLQEGVPLSPGSKLAPMASPDYIECQVRPYKRGFAEAIGPNLPIWVTIVSDAACSAETEVFIVTQTLWEYNGSTYTELNETVDNEPTTYAEYAVTAACKPLHQYHVEFQVQAFHGHWAEYFGNSDAQVYC
jgi:hypothetical protein